MPQTSRDRFVGNNGSIQKNEYGQQKTSEWLFRESTLDAPFSFRSRLGRRYQGGGLMGKPVIDTHRGDSVFRRDRAGKVLAYRGGAAGDAAGANSSNARTSGRGRVVMKKLDDDEEKGRCRSRSSSTACSNPPPLAKRLKTTTAAATATMGSSSGSNNNNNNNKEGGELKVSESLRWFLGDISPSRFFNDIFEKKPVFIPARGDRDRKRAESMFDYTFMLDVIRNNELYYNDSMTLCVFEGGKRKTTSLEGIAEAERVHDLYTHHNHTVQFYRPQRFSDPICRFNKDLEGDFEDLVGASVYLTPPASQGLAPHHDDVEVFIVQTQGEKHWKVFAPREGEELPRDHSQDLDISDVDGGGGGVGGGGGEGHNKTSSSSSSYKLVLDVTLRKGDRLYMPRGFVHYARCPSVAAAAGGGGGSKTSSSSCSSPSSCHVTVSTFQRHSIADFLLALAPVAIGEAFKADISFRKGLPRDFLSVCGTAAPQLEMARISNYIVKNRDRLSDTECAALEEEIKSRGGLGVRGADFVSRIRQCFVNVLRYINMDTIANVCDQMGVEFIQSRLAPLPPSISSQQRQQEGRQSRNPLEESSVFRLQDPKCMRLVMEEGSATLFHSFQNSRQSHMGMPSEEQDEEEDDMEEEEEEGDEGAEEKGGGDKEYEESGNPIKQHDDECREEEEKDQKMKAKDTVNNDIVNANKKQNDDDTNGEEEGGGEEEEEEEEEERPDGEHELSDPCLTFPGSMGLPLAILMNSYPAYLSVGDFMNRMQVENNQGGKMELGSLLVGLWMAKLLEVKTISD